MTVRALRNLSGSMADRRRQVDPVATATLPIAGLQLRHSGSQGMSDSQGERLDLTDPSGIDDEEEHLSNVHAPRRTVLAAGDRRGAGPGSCCPSAAGRRHGTTITAWPRPSPRPRHTAEVRGRRDDPQPLPRRRPRPGDRRDNAEELVDSRRRRSCATSSPTTSRPGPRASRTRSSNQKPDLVGLQEVALWQTARRSPGRRRRDHGQLRLPQLLLDRAQQGPGAATGSSSSSRSSTSKRPADDERSRRRRAAARRFANAEIVGRLTMRDVILARNGAGVHTWNEQGAQLQHPDRTADPRPAETDRPRLDVDRRQGSRQRPVPLRQHAPGVVPSR